MKSNENDARAFFAAAAAFFFILKVFQEHFVATNSVFLLLAKLKIIAASIKVWNDFHYKCVARQFIIWMHTHTHSYSQPYTEALLLNEMNQRDIVSIYDCSGFEFELVVIVHCTIYIVLRYFVLRCLFDKRRRKSVLFERYIYHDDRIALHFNLIATLKCIK